MQCRHYNTINAGDFPVIFVVRLILSHILNLALSTFRARTIVTLLSHYMSIHTLTNTHIDKKKASMQSAEIHLFSSFRLNRLLLLHLLSVSFCFSSKYQHP